MDNQQGPIVSKRNSAQKKKKKEKPTKKTRAQSLALPLAAHAALSKLLNFSVPWLPHLWNELTHMVWNTNEVM